MGGSKSPYENSHETYEKYGATYVCCELNERTLQADRLIVTIDVSAHTQEPSEFLHEDECLNANKQCEDGNTLVEIIYDINESIATRQTDPKIKNRKLKKQVLLASRSVATDCPCIDGVADYEVDPDQLSGEEIIETD